MFHFIFLSRIGEARELILIKFLRRIYDDTLSIVKQFFIIITIESFN